MLTLAPALSRRLPFYYGWVVISVTAIVSFTSVSFLPGVIGALFTPMSDEFGWSRTVVPGAVLAGSVMVIVVAPVSGRLVDRYGGRPVISVGTLVMAAALLGLGLTNSIFMFYVVFGIGFAMFNSITRVAMSAITAQWFVRRRGLATSLSAGTSALGFIVLPLVAALISDEWGWRWAWAAMGMIILIAAVPASLLLLLASPQDVGQRVDGDKTEQDAAQTSRLGRSAATEVQWTVREAIRTPTLWMLLVGLSVQAIATNGILLHQVPHLEDQGLSRNVAVLAFTFAGVGHTSTVFFWGWLADRLDIRYLYLIGSSFLIAFVLVLLVANSLWMVIVLGLLQGVGFGGNVLVMRLAYPNYFGRRSAGGLQGFVTPPQLLVAGSGGLVSGVMFNISGSYTIPFMFFAVLMAVAMVIVLLVPKPVKRPQPEDVAATAQV